MSSGTTKGSWQRPHDKAKFDANYDAIFGKKDAPQEVKLDRGTMTMPNGFQVEVKNVTITRNVMPPEEVVVKGLEWTNEALVIKALMHKLGVREVTIVANALTRDGGLVLSGDKFGNVTITVSGEVQ